MKVIHQDYDGNSFESSRTIAQDIDQVGLAVNHPLSSFKDPSLIQSHGKGHVQSEFPSTPSQSCKCQL
jgi:hypothetical protein